SVARRCADWTALAASFFLSITYVHLHYSRIGLRTISLPLFLALSYGFLFRGLRRESWLSLALSGLFGGITIYTYIPSRIAPALLILPILVLGWQRRSWQPLRQMMFVGLIWLIVAAPLGVYALRHPDQIFGHTGDVSILSPLNNHGDPVGAVIHGFVATMAAFDFVGTSAAEQNLPGRPILDPIMSVFLFIGLVWLLAGGGLAPHPSPTMEERGSAPAPSGGELPFPHALREGTGGSGMPRLVTLFLLAWILSQCVSSALAVNPPGYIRMTGTLPAVAIVIGSGVSVCFAWLRKQAMSPVVPVGVTALLLAASTVWTMRDYFTIWGPSPEAYHLMMADKADAATDLVQWAKGKRLFLAPLYAQDNTIKFLTQNAPIQSFDLGLSLVVPTDRTHDVRYAFPASETDAIETVQHGLSAPPLNLKPNVTTVRDPTGRFDVLTVLDLPRSALPSPPSSRLAVFQGVIALVAATATPNQVAPGQPLSVTLEWLALQHPSEDETVFLHLRDAKNQTVAQMDRQPTGGSLPTSQWRPGDLVWDRYSLALPASLPPGQYHLVTGLYQLKTLKRLEAQTPAGRADSDEVTVAQVEVSAR
ncbi:MAG TPA: glycosyltransferase family 39 protein, partial [Chloroflexota bacterium]|nr:glycosyltransferase family 39 protein [Chloroflexota bacterium]